jgi:hypothetical protein
MLGGGAITDGTTDAKNVSPSDHCIAQTLLVHCSPVGDPVLEAAHVGHRIAVAHLLESVGGLCRATSPHAVRHDRVLCGVGLREAVLGLKGGRVQLEGIGDLVD